MKTKLTVCRSTNINNRGFRNTLTISNNVKVNRSQQQVIDGIYRITEDGDTRITENESIRILE